MGSELIIEIEIDNKRIILETVRPHMQETHNSQQQ